jgi:hypothetical protein
MTCVSVSLRKSVLGVKTAHLLSVSVLVFALNPMLHAADSCNAIDPGEIEQKVAKELGFPQKTLFSVPRADLDGRLIDL